MENPYSPPTHSETIGATQFSILNIAIFTVTLALVIANYFTAHSIRVEIVDLFMHVCFLSSPFAFVMHVNNLQKSIKRRCRLERSWILLLLVTIPVSFALSLTPSFSNNQYEGFAAMNRFFGPYGWIQWGWLLVLGILPFAMSSRHFRSSRLLTGIVSVIAISGHVHNAFYALLSCHSPD